MKKPFKVLATSSLLLMLAACNTNDNAAYDALNPNEDVTNVSDNRGDNLGDAFRLRNGNDTAEELDTRNVANRPGQYGMNKERGMFDFTYDRNDANEFFNNNGNGNGRNMRSDLNVRDYERRNTNDSLAGNMDDTISADFTTINSGKFPHTKAVQIREAKYGYVVVNPQGKQITVPDLQSVTEQYVKRFQSQFAQQGGGGFQQQQQAQQRPIQQTPPQQQPAGQPTQQAQPGQQQAQKPSTQAPTATPSQPAKTTQTTAGISATEQQVINLTNAERRKAGLKDLIGDTKLSSVARTKSNDMQKNGYFSHTSPTYGSPFDMMRDFGVTYSTAGENIAQGQRTPEEVVRAWMNSEGHRRNILNGAYTHIGVGHDTTGNHWTQMFIGK